MNNPYYPSGGYAPPPVLTPENLLQYQQVVMFQQVPAEEVERPSIGRFMRKFNK